MGFPGGSDGKESACNVEDPSSIPGSGRPPGEGNGNPLQYSYLGNPMDRGAWWATVHRVAKSQTWLSDFTLATWCEEPTHWKRPDAGKDWGQEEKGATEDEIVGWHHRLSGHELEQIWGDSDGQGSLACCSPWGHKELDMIERLNNNRWH